MARKEQCMLTLEERIYGFAKLWSDAGRYFAFWDKLKDLDWDDVYKKYLPGIIAAENTLAYYGEMKKVAALLKDGHTQVILPSHLMPPYDLPIATSYIEEKLQS